MISKTPLSLELYSKYEISQDFEAYIISITDLFIEDVHRIEDEYEEKHYKIFHVDCKRNAKNLFDLTLIIAESKTLFSKSNT